MEQSPLVDHGAEKRAASPDGAVGRAGFWVVEGGSDNQISRLERDRMRDFARASSDWFWEIDAASRLSMLSDRLVALLGRPVSVYVGQPFEDLGRFGRNLGGELPMREALARRQPFREQMFEADDADGLRRVFHLNGVPVFDAAGRFAGYRGSGIDVSEIYRVRDEAEGAKSRLNVALGELSRAQGELSRAAIRADRSEYTKEQFLGIVNHELRTPLNAIIGFAETMEMQLFGALGDRYLHYCRDILDASQHLLGLIEDILEVADISEGSTAMQIGEVKLSDLANEARVLVEGGATLKKITIGKFEIDPGCRVRADRHRLKQILVNLLSNAIKFTPEGGKVGVEAAPSDGRADARVLITVWDTGVGIPPESQEAVFGMFEQLGEDVYTRTNEGTGLGLHISRQLARAMGGDIKVVSARGQGSRFTVDLPAN